MAHGRRRGGDLGRLSDAAVRARSCSCNPPRRRPRRVGGVVRLAAARSDPRTSDSVGSRQRCARRRSPDARRAVLHLSRDPPRAPRLTVADGSRARSGELLRQRGRLGEVGISATRRVLRAAHARRSHGAGTLRRGGAVLDGSRTGRPHGSRGVAARRACHRRRSCAGRRHRGGDATPALHRRGRVGRRGADVAALVRRAPLVTGGIALCRRAIWSGDVAVVPQQQPARHPSRPPGRAVVPAPRRAPRHRRRRPGGRWRRPSRTLDHRPCSSPWPTDRQAPRSC